MLVQQASSFPSRTNKFDDELDQEEESVIPAADRETGSAAAETAEELRHAV
jgi:hypothetical protein